MDSPIQIFAGVRCIPFENEINDEELRLKLEILTESKMKNLTIRPYYAFRGSEFSNEEPVNLGDSILIPAGLILYHMTSNTRDNRFRYPNPGSFYSYTPMHPMNIIDELRYRDIESSKHEGRLIRFVLKKDLTLRVAYGDFHECLALSKPETQVVRGWGGKKEIRNRPAITRIDDGAIVAGYKNPQTSDKFTPVDEILLCDSGSDVLEFIDEIVFDKYFLNIMASLRYHPPDFTARYTGLGSIREFLYTKPRICPTQELFDFYKSNGYQLTNVSEVEGAVYLFEFLRDKLSFPYRFMFFDTEVTIYVISSLDNVYDIRGLVLISMSLEKLPICSFGKLWKSSDLTHSIVTWPLVKFLLDFNMVTVRRDMFEEKRCDRIIFMNEDLIELQSEGIFLDDYMENYEKETVINSHVSAWTK